MSLTTYSDLKAAVIAWPDLQGEVDLEQYADTCITLGESRINQLLRLQGSIKEVTLATRDGAWLDLPDDYLEMDRVTGPSSESLEYRPADEMDRWGCAPDAPAYYSITGRRMGFSAVTDSVTLRYYAKLPPLEQSETNWLYQLAPGLYLYASLIEAATFSKEAEQEIARYRQAFDQNAAQLMELDWASRQPRSQPLRAIPAPSGRKSRS